MNKIGTIGDKSLYALNSLNDYWRLNKRQRWDERSFYAVDMDDGSVIVCWRDTKIGQIINGQYQTCKWEDLKNINVKKIVEDGEDRLNSVLENSHKLLEKIMGRLD